MLNIDTEGYTNFSISVQKNNDIQSKDIVDADNTILIVDKYNNKREETYTITTKNLNGFEETGPYRKTSKSFKVIWG